MMGDHVPLTSSNVASIAYDPDEQVLEVRFHNASLYRYSGVPQEVYDAFLAAPSPGRFMWANIRGVYEYSKVE